MLLSFGNRRTFGLLSSSPMLLLDGEMQHDV
jgi:hypothetical protein